MTDRRDLLSSAEVQRILQRSSQLEQTMEDRLYSVADVIQAAREAGLDEGAVRAAMSELLTQREREQFRGIPPTTVMATVFASRATMLDPTRNAVADAVTRALGPAGIVAREGSSLRWREAPLEAVVYPTGSGASITVAAGLQERATSSAVGASVAAGAGAVLVARILGVPAESALPLVGVLGGGALVGHGIWRLYWRRQLGRWRSRVFDLAERIRAELEDTTHQ